MAKSYEINGRPVSKQEYEEVMGKVQNNFSSDAKPVENKTADMSSTSNSPSGQTIQLGNIDENTLDSIDLPTCLWSLYMISEESFLGNRDLNSIKLSSNNRKVLIAASGRTDEFTISNLNIDSKIGMLPGVNTNVTFDITTPYSSDLIDKMLTSAALLGINNYSKAPLMLELNVKGRDPKTGMSKHLTTRSFAIFIKGMSFSLNEEGARYSVDASSVNDLPRGDVAENLNEQINLQGTNPKELLEDLGKKLLDREEGAISVRKDVADQYSFVFEDNATQIANEVIKPDAFVAPTRSTPKNKEKEEKTTATENPNHTPSNKVSVDYEKGTGVTTIIENIITNSPVLKKKVTEYEEKNKKFAEQLKADGKASSAKKVNIKQFYNFDTQVTYLGYDFLRRDYAKKYEYRISMYDTPFGYVAQTDVSTDKKQNVDRLTEIRDKLGIRKLYHYMYTGKNDQIIEMNYNFDNMFYVAIGAQSEIIDSFKFEPGVRYDEGLRKKLDEARIASNNLKLYTKYSKLDKNNKEDAKERLKIQQQLIENDPDLRNRMVAAEYDPTVTFDSLVVKTLEKSEEAVYQGSKELREYQNATEKSIDNATGGSGVSTENENVKANSNVGQAINNRKNNTNIRSNGGNITVAGKVNPNTGANTIFAGDVSRQAFVEYYKEKPLPVMFYETGKVTQTGVEGDTTPGGGLLAQYFNNAKNVGSTGDMMNVEMTIKGDLFYLPDLSRNSSQNRNIQISKPLMIIITSNQVSEYNKDGFMRINRKNALNGLYMVIEANHRWQDDGQYVITLGLRRELGTDLHGLTFRSS